MRESSERFFDDTGLVNQRLEQIIGFKNNNDDKSESYLPRDNLWLFLR
jgi:hypothetical protein